jgi:pimeloyl-ACP methyl ester carboxylesterase
MAAAVAGVAATNALIAALTPPARPGLGGSFARYPYRHGSLAYTVAGEGPPLLLLHGLGMGNSMAEWAANFDDLRLHHTVYALDLPGWGLSSKPKRAYTAEDFIEAILFFMEDVVVGDCALIAAGDSCNFAVEAAARRPDLCTHLVLVCPPTHTHDVALETVAPLVERAFALPVLGAALSNIIASRAAIAQYCTGQLYYDKALVTADIIDRYYVAAHQPGARYGLAAVVQGTMAIDVRPSWSRIHQPALLVWGRHARINSIETAPEWLALKPDAELHVIDDAMLLPHNEHAPEFNEFVLQWLK